MSKTTVSIVRFGKNPTYAEIEANVRKAIELAGGLGKISKGDLVLVKPNICSPAAPGNGQVTNPHVAKAVADMAREAGARVIIAESSGVLDKDTEASFKANGYAELRAMGYELVDLKAPTTPMATIKIPHGKVIKEATLPRLVVDAKLIISIPVMKTHAGQKVTLALKNLKGMLPDTWKKKLHTVYGVAPGLTDILSVLKPGFALVDGIIGQEGLGPIVGTPIEMDIFVAGRDIVAVDAVTCSIMGFDPKEVPMIVAAAEKGLGMPDLADIRVVGIPIKAVQRKFKSVEEAVQETLNMPSGLKVLIGEKACTGCRESVMFVLRDLGIMNKLDLLEGWTILAGQTSAAPRAEKDKLLLVGACTAKHKHLGKFVEGCPPPSWDVAEAITGQKLAAWHD
jgi:uncharacterized protein (DUF362 family)